MAIWRRQRRRRGLGLGRIAASAAIHDRVQEHGSEDAAGPLGALSPVARRVRTRGPQIGRRGVHRGARAGHRALDRARGRWVLGRRAGRRTGQSSSNVKKVL